MNDTAEYTPTTTDVLAAWLDAHSADAWGGRIDVEARPKTRVAEFDRWLVAHDREVAARAREEALAEARDAIEATDPRPDVTWGNVGGWALGRRDSLAVIDALRSGKES